MNDLINDGPGLAIDVAVEHDAWGAPDHPGVLAERAAAAALTVAAETPTHVDAPTNMDTPPDVEVSLVLCDDAFIRALNKTWRGKDQPTNVLSFPTEATAPGAGPALLGDIVVAFETSAREAAEEGRGLDDHLAHLIVHGMFHLLGYDHEDEREADVMEGLEVRALEMLGIASPYAGDGDRVDAEDARAHP